MGRHWRVAAHEEIIEDQADLDDQRAAFGGFVQQAHEFQRCVEQSGEPAVDRDRCGQRLGQMRGIAQQAVALVKGFPHQAEFAIFQVTDAAVQHVRGGHTGSGAEVFFVHQQHINALQRQIAKSADAVDASPDDED